MPRNVSEMLGDGYARRLAYMEAPTTSGGETTSFSEAELPAARRWLPCLHKASPLLMCLASFAAVVVCVRLFHGPVPTAMEDPRIPKISGRDEWSSQSAKTWLPKGPEGGIDTSQGLGFTAGPSPMPHQQLLRDARDFSVTSVPAPSTTARGDLHVADVGKSETVAHAMVPGSVVLEPALGIHEAPPGPVDRKDTAMPLGAVAAPRVSNEAMANTASVDEAGEVATNAASVDNAGVDTRDMNLISLLPLPRCQCRGPHGSKDAYRGGRPTDAYLCMSPWGNPHGHQYCYRTSRTGKCLPTMQKCNNTASKPAGGDRGVIPEGAKDGPCLCGFDIDRTLTAKQGSANESLPTNSSNISTLRHCASTQAVDETFDAGFDGGQLTLSALSTHGVANTACADCYVAITSRGDASGTTEKLRAALLKAIMTKPFAEIVATHAEATTWTNGSATWEAKADRYGYGSGRIHSPLVLLQLDRQKQWAMEGVLQWYASKGIHIDRSRVFFFDDRADNALYFNGTGMNARQISCTSRDSTPKPTPPPLVRPKRPTTTSKPTTTTSTTPKPNANARRVLDSPWDMVEGVVGGNLGETQETLSRGRPPVNQPREKWPNTAIGYCGARPEEIVLKPGVYACPQSSETLRKLSVPSN